MNIYQKLQTARIELQNMKLKKTGFNNYSNYQYYELSDFLPAVNTLCNKHGLFTRFNIISNHGTEKAVLTILNTEKPEEKVDFVSPTAEVEIGRKKDGSGGAEPIQNLGGKTTYMRRYMFITAFEIVESDIVEKVNEQTKDELSPEDIDSIMNSKTQGELIKVCADLTKTHKRQAVTQLYEERKKQISGGEK